jgi:GntR family transcriptional regulator
MNDAPKYFQIGRDIRSRIQKGKLAPGMPVLSENEIIEFYKVSNTTARRALHELEQEGWVTRCKGRGTFVSHDVIVRSIDRIFGFTRNMVEAGRTPATRLLGFRLHDKSRAQMINGRSYKLKGPYCEIERIRFADGIPMMSEFRYISLTLCPEIQRQDLEKSLYTVFDEIYGLQLTEINQMLSAVILKGNQLKAFEAKEPIPAFRVEGVSFCGKGLVIEMEDSLYRGDLYKFAARALPEKKQPFRRSGRPK